MFSSTICYLTIVVLVAGISLKNPSIEAKLTNAAKSNAVLENIVDHKDFRKLLRTKTNILVLFLSEGQQKSMPSSMANVALNVFREAASVIRGTGTMLLIDCSHSEKRKLCKKLKVPLESPYTLRHYHEGDYHKEYDRQLSINSMVNFMRDPAGDLPWEEDPIGQDVIHFADYLAFMKHLKSDDRAMMVMFHVPWCGFCKRLKPEYSKAATELKDEGYILAAMDVEVHENALARKIFNVTGFPTLIYFKKGKMQQTYEGEYTKDGIMTFMRDPSSAALKKSLESDWSVDSDSEIVHLTKQGFEPALKDEKSVLVMFYAPWCGHCKRLKPEYEKAAFTLKSQTIPGLLAALDATKESGIAERFQVKGYPTLKYFVYGQYKFDVNLRDAQKIVEFMRDPKEPPPPPPPETPWEEETDTHVLFLTQEDFASNLKRKKHALVMFYAPWCGHCKNMKPEFNAAAKQLKDEARVVFVAVDCTRQNNLCTEYSVKGFPTIKYFSYLKTHLDYQGGRKRDELLAYINNAMKHSKSTNNGSSSSSSNTNRDEL